MTLLLLHKAWAADDLVVVGITLDNHLQSSHYLASPSTLTDTILLKYLANATVSKIIVFADSANRIGGERCLGDPSGSTGQGAKRLRAFKVVL